MRSFAVFCIAACSIESPPTRSELPVDTRTEIVGPERGLDEAVPFVVGAAGYRATSPDLDVRFDGTVHLAPRDEPELAVAAGVALDGDDLAPDAAVLDDGVLVIPHGDVVEQISATIT